MAAYTTVDDAGSFFNTKLYTGTAAENVITGVGFSADFTWIKRRSSTGAHYAFDTVRGATKAVIINDTDVEDTNAEFLKSWESDGFTLGTSGGPNGSYTYASWNWKAGTTSGITAGSQTITPSGYSINTTSGFGIYEYSGASATSTIAHGLGATPTLIIVKGTSHATNWQVGSTAMDSTWNYVLYLNLQHSKQNEIMYGDTPPDATYFTLGNASETNGSGRDYIAYAWTPIQGYSKFGTYNGNSDADGPLIYTGFQPAFILVKRYDSGTEDWNLWNNKALGYNVDNNKIYANLTNAEVDADEVDLVSNGFKWRTTNGGLNASGGSYAYMAFASNPLVNSESIPGNAR